MGKPEFAMSLRWRASALLVMIYPVPGRGHLLLLVTTHTAPQTYGQVNKQPWWLGYFSSTYRTGGLAVQGTMERGGMPIGPRGPGAVLPGRGRGMGPPAEWNGRVGSAEQRGGFMQRAPPAGTVAPKTPADRLVLGASPNVGLCCRLGDPTDELARML